MGNGIGNGDFFEFFISFKGLGFDGKYIYTADSMKEHMNCENKPYNRRISISEFKKIWLTSKIYQPLMFNLFFEISR